MRKLRLSVYAPFRPTLCDLGVGIILVCLGCSPLVGLLFAQSGEVVRIGDAETDPFEDLAPTAEEPTDATFNMPREPAEDAGRDRAARDRAGSGETSYGGGPAFGTRQEKSGRGAGRRGRSSGEGSPAAPRGVLENAPSSPHEATSRANELRKQAMAAAGRKDYGEAGRLAILAWELLQLFKDDPRCQELAVELRPQIMNWTELANLEGTTDPSIPLIVK